MLNDEKYENEKMDMDKLRKKLAHDLFIIYDTVKRFSLNKNHDMALDLCKVTLSVLEKYLGHYHPEVARMLHVMALIHRNKKTYVEAYKLMDEVLTILVATLGPEHPHIVTTLTYSGVLCAKDGRYREAETFCKKALSLKQNMIGEKNPLLVPELSNLARICTQLHKFEESEQLYLQALKLHDPDGPYIGVLKCNFAECYLCQGRFRDGELLLKEFLLYLHNKKAYVIEGFKESLWEVVEKMEIEDTIGEVNITDTNITNLCVLKRVVRKLMYIYAFQKRELPVKILKKVLKDLKNPPIVNYNE